MRGCDKLTDTLTCMLGPLCLEKSRNLITVNAHRLIMIPVVQHSSPECGRESRQVNGT